MSSPLDYHHSKAAQFVDDRPALAEIDVFSPETAPARESGSEVVGRIPWGTHFCQFYETSQDLVEILVPYFREGLLANEFCMWITSAPLQVEQATAALRAAVPNLDHYLAQDQIEILDYSQWYTRAGTFQADDVLQGWMDKLASARERGYEGLRLTGNTFWLEKTQWEDFYQYEEKVNSVIGRQRMLAICTYSLDKCGANEILDVVANHQFALAKRAGRWEMVQSTQQAKTEQALRESEERLRLSVWAAELGVFEWDVLNDRAIWENQRMYDIFGRALQDGPLSQAQLIEQAIHPADAASFRAALEEGMRPGHLFRCVCRIRRRNDRELRWVEFSGRFEHAADGTPLRLLGVLADITERIHMEQALRKRETLLAQAGQMAHLGAWDIEFHDDKDLGANPLTWSDEVYRIFGYEPGAVTVTNDLFIDRVHPDDRARVSEAVAQALARRQAYQVEHRVVRSDGTERLVQEHAEIVFDNEDRPVRMVGAVQDITERKQAEEERERLAKEIATVEERQRLARDLHDAVNQSLFAASTISDVLPKIMLRNPDEGWQQLKKLNALTRGAQAEMRTLLLELRPSGLVEKPLGELLQQLVIAMSGRTHLPIGVTVKGDRCLQPDVQVALYRITQETLNNIVKHAEASEVLVDLSCDAEHAELCISDNGRGFDMQRFSADHMGLRNMRERAEAIGAQLSIESEIGHGTVVRVVWRGKV